MVEHFLFLQAAAVGELPLDIDGNWELERVEFGTSVPGLYQVDFEEGFYKGQEKEDKGKGNEEEGLPGEEFWEDFSNILSLDGVFVDIILSNIFLLI